jgi:mycothiol system anti-sigma-R factor
MGDCEETLHELYAYLDGELEPHTRSVVQRHLDGCTDCLQAFEFHYELRGVIASKCHSDRVPDGLRDRILSCFGSDALDDPDTPIG